MSEPKGLQSERTAVFKYFRFFMLLVAFAAVIYLVVRNFSAFGNVLMVVLGFGAVVFVHEFGHFIVAKLSDIKVEAFSIGFPPTLAGVLRTERGWRIRILPDFFPKGNSGSDDGLLSFTIGKRAKAGQTEYRIGLIPFGGFVKMLGQEDVGSVKASDDPRSFANKSVICRVGVIAAGVFFNAISAIIVFMIVFLIGINRIPAVVGGVRPNSPAARAGLKAGDEIIEIAGETNNLEFSNILIAAALSGRNEEIAVKVKHEDGTIEEFALVAERTQTPMGTMRIFGVFAPQSLTITELFESDANDLRVKIGLIPGDRIKSVNGLEVHTHWQLEKIVRNALAPEVTLLVERGEPNSVELIESRIGLETMFAGSYEVESESELYHVYSMVPRLRVTAYSGMQEISLRAGDVILAIGDVENPTYTEMREVVVKSEDKELAVKVLRVDANGVVEDLVVTVVPRRLGDTEWVQIGAALALDVERPVVSKTIEAEGGPARVEIPRGAAITAVDGVRVSSFYDVIREIKRNTGRRIMIDYRLDEKISGGVALDLSGEKEFITVETSFAEFVPFEDLKIFYKASGPIEAITMGYKKTVMFIAQTYVTLKRLIGGLVSPKDLMGPVGIVTFSYRIVSQQPLVYYIYFLGLISACIAVFNFLPLPPLDGGLVVFLLVEKIKGSALSERVQGIIAYAGWALIGTLFLYVTFNDIVRSFFR